jgi:hypothetical protein
MKRFLLLALISTFAVSGCKTAPNTKKEDGNTTIAEKKVLPALYITEGNTIIPIEKMPHQIGVSSYMVERLAQNNQCEPLEGASLLTPKGPVEVYRMPCKDGKTFMARCELRQCQPMPIKSE